MEKSFAALALELVNLKKSQVKAHTRKTASGKVVPVKAHTNKVVKKAPMIAPKNEHHKKQTGEPVLDSLNPTGGLFVKYSANQIANMKTGKNITTLDKTSGKSPDTIVTIYRGAPKSQVKITAGDYVTTNPELAKDYAGDGHVISLRVKMKHVLDDKDEPLGEEYIYKP